MVKIRDDIMINPDFAARLTKISFVQEAAKQINSLTQFFSLSKTKMHFSHLFSLNFQKHCKNYNSRRLSEPVGV